MSDAAPDPGSADAAVATADDDVDDDVDVDVADAASTAERLRRYLTYGALLALGLLAVVAGVQVYLNLSTVVSQWVAPQYRSAFRAAFNLAVLLAALAAIYGLLERVGD